MGEHEELMAARAALREIAAITQKMTAMVDRVLGRRVTHHARAEMREALARIEELAQAFGGPSGPFQAPEEGAPSTDDPFDQLADDIAARPRNGGA